jgi:plastocyanin
MPLLALLVIAALPAAAAQPAAPSATGTLAGRITLNGLAPKLANLPVTRDMKTCGTSKPDESLEVKDSGVKNAVIWLTDVPEPKDFKPPTEKLDQQGCVFVPHVLVAPVGATVDVINDDKALHNVRAQAGADRLFNYAMPIPGQVVPTKLKKEGIFRLSCDVHPWMRGWLLALPTTHFALSGEDGRYSIADLPPGKHKIKIWHERFGERDAEVEIAAGSAATYDVAYNPR